MQQVASLPECWNSPTQAVNHHPPAVFDFWFLEQPKPKAVSHHRCPQTNRLDRFVNIGNETFGPLVALCLGLVWALYAQSRAGPISKPGPENKLHCRVPDLQTAVRGWSVFPHTKSNRSVQHVWARVTVLWHAKFRWCDEFI